MWIKKAVNVIFNFTATYQGKSTHTKHSLLKSKPYEHKTAANSSNWKQNRKTKLIDINEARQLHTDTSTNGNKYLAFDFFCLV